MIARAAEGSARDGLSLLDQAIAYGEAKVKAEDVAGMLGLIDRSRIIDLFEAVMAGDAAKAIDDIEAQHESGGDPETILSDLADFVHWVTRLKVVQDSALTDASRTRRKNARRRLCGATWMAHLTRAWQMLLKGISEMSYAGQPLMAAEMVLIRLAYAADLPSGEDLLKLVKQDPPAEKSAPIVRPSPQTRLAHGRNRGLACPEARSCGPAGPHRNPRFSPTSAISRLAGEKRDVKLKGDLERSCGPFASRPARSNWPSSRAPLPGLPGELSRKLEAWTGRRWMVLVAREGGDKPLALQKKEARESVFREAREQPAVQAILKRFPGAGDRCARSRNLETSGRE